MPGTRPLRPPSPSTQRPVERDNGAWRYGFNATRDLPDDDLEDIDRRAFADGFNVFRPRHAFDGQTPNEHLQSLAAKETLRYHMHWTVLN